MADAGQRRGKAKPRQGPFRGNADAEERKCKTRERPGKTGGARRGMAKLGEKTR